MMPKKIAVRKKVYKWFGTMVIASNRDKAKSIINSEFETRANIRDIKRAKPPYSMTDGDTEWEVGESEFVRTVTTYGGGIVQEFD
jgi:hypothetical protein